MAYVPMSQISRGFAAIMATHGESFVLKRQGQSDLPVAGKRFMKARSNGTDGISDSTVASDLVIKISNAEIAAASWPGPPVAGDILTLGDGSNEWSIEKVDTRADQGVVLGHLLYVVGSG